ncbi:MAG: HEAT repeat domain-containing protein, partial [Acidobacteriota bacterium]
RRPIVCNHYRYSEELMDRHAYEKGAFVLSMLRAALGDEPFFRSLAHFLKKHAFGAAETTDLRVAIEEATGRNLSWFFEQWVFGEGIPELEVEYEWRREEKTVRLLVKQVQSQSGTTRLFRLPVEIEIVSEQTGEPECRDSYQIVIESAQQELYFPCANKPRLVVFDKGHKLLKVLRFPKSTQELLFQLKHDEDVLGRVRAARELASSRSENIVRELNVVLEGDDFWGVRLAAALSLGEIGTAEARDALLAVLATSSDAKVRRGIACGLGSYKDSEVVAALATALNEDQSYFVAAAAARALANIGSAEAYAILTRALAGSSWQEVVRVAVFHGFAVGKEQRSLDDALRHSRYGEHPAVRVAAITCLGALGKELHPDGGDDRIVDHLIALLKDKSIRSRVTAVRALGRIGNRRAIGPLREAMLRECLDQLKGAIEDSIDSIEKAEKKLAPECKS